MTALKRKDKLFLREILFLILAILIIAGGGGLGIIWLKSHTALTAKEIQQIEWEIDKLNRKEQYIDTQLAAMRSPDYLNQLAKQFGLSAPQKRQIIRLSSRSSESLSTQPKTKNF